MNLQMRGVGLSEPVDRRPTLEEQASDIAAVMDAAGLQRAQLFAVGATAPGAVVFAASYPDRVDGLVLACPYLSGPLADDPDLTGWEPGAARRFAEWWLQNIDRWGSGVVIDGWDPAIASPGITARSACSSGPLPADPSRGRTLRPRYGPMCPGSPLRCSALYGFCICPPTGGPRP